MNGVTIILIVLALVSTVLVLGGIYRSAKKETLSTQALRKLREDMEEIGISATAHIIAAEYYGPSIFGPSNAGYSLSLEVMHGEESYVVTQNMLCAVPGANVWDVSVSLVDRVRVGDTLPVKVHPRDSRIVMIDEDALNRQQERKQHGSSKTSN